jgi:hypothetical protein
MARACPRECCRDAQRHAAARTGAADGHARARDGSRLHSADRGAPGRQRAAVVAAPETSSDDRAVGAASQIREITDVLTKLAGLRDIGALTDQEFNGQKQRLLGGR